MACQHETGDNCRSEHIINSIRETYDENHVKTMNVIIKHVTTSPRKRISYKKLDVDALAITVFSDASFSYNDESSSQFCYTIFLTDEYNNENLIYYANMKSRRVVKLVLHPETFELADTCYSAILIQH